MTPEMIFLKLAKGSEQAAEQQGSIWPTIAMFAVIILVFYFLMIRPQRKRQKEEDKMRNNLQIGDEVITIGGIFGRVVNIKDDSLVIESPADHSKFKILRNAIQTNVTAQNESQKAKAAASRLNGKEEKPQKEKKEAPKKEKSEK